jgi:hypothetical protein
MQAGEAVQESSNWGSKKTYSKIGDERTASTHYEWHFFITAGDHRAEFKDESDNTHERSFYFLDAYYPIYFQCSQT